MILLIMYAENVSWVNWESWVNVTFKIAPK